MFFTRIHVQCDGAAVGMPQSDFETFGQPLACIVAHLEAVDDDINRVLLVFVELGQGVDFKNLAIDAQTHKTLSAQLGEQILLFALAISHDGRNDHQLGVFGQGQHMIDHLRHGLRLQRQMMFRAVGCAGARKEQAQVVVNLGDGAHGGTRVMAGRLLFDRNRRRQALDQIDIGFFHKLQKLTCVGGETLDVAALPLGVEGVEGERTFARARQAGNHDQLVTRQVEADVLQIVRARTADADVFHNGFR